jgi:branched-chain amino acid transport system substrate-binding protein
MDRRQAVQGLAGILLFQQAPYLRAQTILVVGQSAPLSGANAEFGRAIYAGARAWFMQYNRRTGFQVQHSVLDDANDTTKSLANTKELLARGAGVLFGYASATLSLPALPLARDTKTLFFAPFTGASVIHDNFDPLVFTARASYKDEAEKFVDALKMFGANRIAVVHYSDRVGNENRDVVANTITQRQMTSTSIAIERNKQVPDDVILRLTSEKPEGILFTTLAAPTANIVTRAREKGLPRSTHLVTLSFVGPSQLHRLLAEESRGLVVSHVVPPPQSKLDIAQEHVAAMRDAGTEAGSPPSFASLEAYIAAKALTTAIDIAKSTRGVAVAAALENMNANFGGYRLKYSKTSRNGSRYVDYTVLGREVAA